KLRVALRSARCKRVPEMISRPLWFPDLPRATRFGGPLSRSRQERPRNEWPKSEMETWEEGLDRRRCCGPLWHYLWRIPSGEPRGETSHGGGEAQGICRLFGNQGRGQGYPLGRYCRAL